MQTLITGYKRRIIPLLLLYSLLVKLILLPFFSDIYYDSSRMLTQYNMAAHLSDEGGFYIDADFLANASGYNNQAYRNIDYKFLLQLVPEKGALIKSPEIQDTWGYAALLGVIWKITGDKSLLYIQVLQILIDGLATLAVFYIVLYLFRRMRLAFFVAMVYASFIPFTFLTIIANRDYYAAWGLIFSLCFFLRGIHYQKYFFNFLTAGFMLGLFSWFRPTIFMVPAVFALYGFIVENPFKARFMMGFKTAVYMGIPVILLFILPFALQYHAKYHEYNFTKSINGIMLWEGLGEYPGPYPFVCDDGKAYERAVSLGYPKEGLFGTILFNRILKEDAMRVIRHDPLFYYTLMGKRYIKAVFLNLPIGFSEKNDISFERSQLSFPAFFVKYPLLFLEKVVKKILQYGLIILLILCIVFYRKQYKELLLLILVWQYKIGVHLPTHMEERYIMEGYFPVVIMAAMACYYIYRHREKILQLKFIKKIIASIHLLREKSS